jgi:Transcriptional regulator
MRVFWQHGYEATSISQLTRAMGINPPSLYAAFGDKRALFSAAVRRYREHTGEATARAFAEERTARDVVARLLREFAAEYTRTDQPRGCMVVTAATNCGPENADVKAELQAMRADTRQAIEDRIADDVRRGILPDTVDPAALAAYYAAVIQGMSIQAVDGADRATLEQIATLAMAAWPTGGREPEH